MNIKRRTFIKNGIALLAAPAIVHAENIMKIAAPKDQRIILSIDAPGGPINDYETRHRTLLQQVSKKSGIPYRALCERHAKTKWSSARSEAKILLAHKEATLINQKHEAMVKNFIAQLNQ